MRGFTDALREPSRAPWDSLVANRFVAEMADATLAPEKFRFYIEQNIFYLPMYARVLGLGLGRATTPRQVRRFTRVLTQIVDVELEANHQLLAEIVEFGAEDRGGSVEPAPACLAYTSYLLATASTGGPVDVMAATLPCAWSYLDIAAQYGQPASHPIYESWLSFFGSDDYRVYVQTLRDEIDDLVGEVAAQEMVGLQHHFLTGIRMERAFWNGAFNLELWD